MADLIERDALIDYMKQIYCERIESSREKCSACVKGRWRGVECSACWVNDCIDDIENAPAVNRWIPCSERFPEVGIDVLIFFPNWKENPIQVACLMYDGLAWDICGEFNPAKDKVTHWMPLPNIPEPPESEEQE